MCPPGAEELAAVAAVVPAFCKGEADATGEAAVAAFITHPVVRHGPPGVLRDAPREHSPPCITHVHGLVIPARGAVKYVRAPLRGKQSPHGRTNRALVAGLHRLVVL